MSFSTFSGPIRAGTARHGATKNTGLVVLSRSIDTGDLTGATQANYDNTFGYLPQGAQILDIIVDQVVAAGTGTTTISVATTSGGRFRGTATAATQLAWQLSTTADTKVYYRYVVGGATLTAGRFILT